MSKHQRSMYLVGLLALSIAVPTQAGTVEYWDFENSTSTGGAPLDDYWFTDTGRGDSGGQHGSLGINGTLARGWDQTAGPQFDDDDLSGPNAGSFAMDTVDAGGDAYLTEGALHNWTASGWTLEMHVKLDAVDAWETLVGRDGSSFSVAESDFYFQRRGDDINQLRLNYRTSGGTQHVVDGTTTLETGVWYGLAAVANTSAGTITLYIDEGAGYVQNGQLTGLSGDLGIYSSGLNWTFGRGWYNGGFGDFIDGHIDNIRFSDSALGVSELLPLLPTDFPIRVTSVSPAAGSTGAHAQPVVEAVIIDGTSVLNTSSIVFTFDGVTVTPSITSTGTGTTTVSYAVGSVLPPASVHTAKVVAAAAAPNSTITNEWTFTVTDWETVPPAWGYPVSLTSTGARGFWYRDVSNDDGTAPDSILPNTEARANAQLAGRLIDPVTRAPYIDYSEDGFTSVSWSPFTYYLMPEDDYYGKSVVNMNINAGVDPGDGNFSEWVNPPFYDEEGYFNGTYYDLLFYDIADETIAYLELDAGLYRIGVNSDDGFVCYMGPEPRDLLAADVGRFDGARGASDTLFSVVIEQAGLYPFRLLHYQGGGGGSLELFTVDVAGNKVLVNDVFNGGVPAWRVDPANQPPYVSYIDPLPGTIADTLNHQVSIELTDGDLALDDGTLSLALDGAPVAASSSKAGNVTTVVYDGGLPFNSTNQFTLVYGAAGSGTLTTGTFEVVTGDPVDAIEVVSVAPEGAGIPNPVSLEAVLADRVSLVDATSLALYLDGELVAHTASKANGITTVTAASSTLAFGPHDAAIVYGGTNPTVGPFTNAWDFVMQAPPASTAVALWNVNIAGGAGGTQRPVTDGSVVVAPATGANLWNNVAGNGGVTNTFAVTDADGGNPIRFRTSGSHNWGESTANNITVEMFQGWCGANAPMDMDIELSGLDPGATYDLYLYSTWRWTQNPVEYTLTEGTASLTNATVTEIQANVQGDGATDYSGVVEGENYAVFVAISPSAEGRIVMHGQCPDGVLSGLQLVQATPGGCVAPTILVDPADAVVKEAAPAPAMFSVTAGGTAPLGYQWRKEGVAIAGATGATFTIDPVSLADEGLYDCVVANACGSTTSAVARLAFQQPPSPTASALWNVNIAGFSTGTQRPVTDGSVVVAPSTGANLWNNVAGNNGVTNTFTVQDADGVNPIVFQTSGSHNWGENLGNNMTVEMFQGWCGANAPMNMDIQLAGLAPNATYDLYLYSTWTWTENTVNYTLTEGTAAAMVGTVSEVRTNVQGDAATDYSGVVEGENYMVFTAVSPSTAGKIVVHGQCPDGILSGLQLVQITPDVCLPASVQSDPADVTVAAAAPAPASFSVAAAGSSPLEFQWRKDGAVIAGATNATLIIDPVSGADAGLYDCVVSNACSSDTSAAAELTYLPSLVGANAGPRLFNINFAGRQGLNVPVPDGTVLEAGELCLNGWNNLVAPSTSATWDPASPLVITDACGEYGITLDWTGILNDHGVSTANALSELNQGYFGRGGFDTTLQVAGLDPNESYDLYVYFTWGWNTNSVTYTVTQGTGVTTNLTLSPNWSTATNYADYVEGSNYVVFPSVTPSATGQVSLRAQSADGGFNAVQIVQAAGGLTSFGITPDGSMVELIWDSDPGTTYSVSRSLDLSAGEAGWTVIQSNITGSAGSTTNTVATGGGDAEIYRVEEE